MTVAGVCVPHQAVIGDSRQLATSATTCGVQPSQQPRFLMVRPGLGWAGLGCWAGLGSVVIEYLDVLRISGFSILSITGDSHVMADRGYTPTVLLTT